MSEEKTFQYINFSGVESGYFYNDTIEDRPPPQRNLKTWKNAGPSTGDRFVDLSWVIAGGKKIEDLGLGCFRDYEAIKAALIRHLRALFYAKVDLK